jgi:HAD superfamily hydrolase (TIGR01509 family)
MKQLIIFDCDGVLVDSEYLANKVFAKVLLNYGYSISIEDSIKRFTGVHEHSCREIIMEEIQIDIPQDYWAREQPNLLKTFEFELSPLLNPLLEMLDKLKIPKCVASNSSHHHVTQCLEFTQTLRYFNKNAIFTSQQVPKPKPAPDLFLFAAKNMGIRPENCIVIEDSLAGAHAATVAGMKVMIFLGGSHARFDWYRDKFTTHDVPMLSSCEELSHAVQCALNE